jgi:hypothetical protein
MESHGLPGTIQLSETARDLLATRYRMRLRGMIDVKGKGAMETWFLVGRIDDEDAAPSTGVAV